MKHKPLRVRIGEALDTNAPARDLIEELRHLPPEDLVALASEWLREPPVLGVDGTARLAAAADGAGVNVAKFTAEETRRDRLRRQVSVTLSQALEKVLQSRVLEGSTPSGEVAGLDAEEAEAWDAYCAMALPLAGSMVADEADTMEVASLAAGLADAMLLERRKRRWVRA